MKRFLATNFKVSLMLLRWIEHWKKVFVCQKKVSPIHHDPFWHCQPNDLRIDLSNYDNKCIYKVCVKKGKIKPLQFFRLKKY